MKYCLYFLVIFLWSLTIHAGEFVVVSSTILLYPEGKILNSHTPIELRKGEALGVISDSGRITKMNGPYQGKINAKATKKTDGKFTIAISRIFNANSKNTSSVGAIRLANQGTPPSPWMLTTERGGHSCFKDLKSVVVWRKEVAFAQKASVRSRKGKEGEVSWKEGEHKAFWPQDILLLDGGVFLMRIKGASVPLKLTFHIVPKIKKSVPEKLAWMIDRECMWQARKLLKIYIK